MSNAGESKGKKGTVGATVWAIAIFLGTHLVNAGTTIYIMGLECPSAFVGVIEDPPGPEITLDNGVAVQTADDEAAGFVLTTFLAASITCDLRRTDFTRFL